MQDRILGALAVAVAIAMGWGARDYVAPISYEPVGPRMVPWLLAVLIGLVGLWLLLRRAPAASQAPAEAGEQPGHRPLLPPRVIAAIAAILVYALLFDLLGFTLATALMTLPVARLFNGSWKQGLITGAAFGIGLFLLFDRLLDVVLPAGLLRGML